jgi:hypothetical protein
MGELSREIAASVPIALVKQFGTRRLQCVACFDAEALATPPSMDCPFQVQSICISTGFGL